MPSQSVELQKQTKTKFIDKENRLMVSESGNGSTVKCIKEVERYKIKNETLKLEPESGSNWQ